MPVAVVPLLLMLAGPAPRPRAAPAPPRPPQRAPPGIDVERRGHHRARHIAGRREREAGRAPYGKHETRRRFTIPVACMKA